MSRGPAHHDRGLGEHRAVLRAGYPRGVRFADSARAVAGVTDFDSDDRGHHPAHGRWMLFGPSWAGNSLGLGQTLDATVNDQRCLASVNTVAKSYVHNLPTRKHCVCLFVDRHVLHNHPSTDAVAFLVVQTLTWTSQRNLAPVSIWLTLMLLREMQSNDASVSRVFKGDVLSIGFTKALPAGVILFIAAAAVGRWPESTSRAGWGIDPTIDGSAFQDSLHDVETSSTAHCLEIREAGSLLVSTGRSKAIRYSA